MPEPIYFASPQEFYDWLEAHHDSETEVYVGYWKKATGKPSLTWSEAVDQALCFGWIDGRVKRIDEERHMQRFTPRKPGSNWSKVNVEKIARLTEAGLMRPAGIAAWEQRREDRTGVYSFEREEVELTPEQRGRFEAHADAWAWFTAQAPSYQRAARHWIARAKKPETRAKRLEDLIAASAEHIRA